MSEDHLQFLKENFILDYEEAVEEFNEELPLRLHFEEILEILNQNAITSSTPIGMKRPLYGLKYALAECVMLAEKEREKRAKEMKRKAQNKRNLPSVSDALDFVKNHWFLFKTRRKLLSIKEQLLQGMRNEHDAAASSSSTNQSLVTVRLQPWEYDFFIEKEIYGFNDHLQKIEAFLLDDGPANSCGIKTLGIIGMGGSGKTALAKKVFCSSLVQESFYPMVWVELPLSPIPLQSIVTAICECLSSCGMNDRDNDLGILLRKMHNCLLNTKYLIVLDGVWHASDWFLNLNSNSNLQTEGNTFCTDHFQHGLPKESGGAIIITSRFQDVAIKIVGEQNLYHLEPTLDRESCWSLILDSMPKFIYQHPCWSLILNSMLEIFDQDSYWSSILASMAKIILHPTLLRMKDEMVDRCDGLPLAAKTLAEILSKKLTEEELQLSGRIERERIRLEKIKFVCFRIDKPHLIPISDLLGYIRLHQGVLNIAYFHFDQNNYEEVVVKAEISFNTQELVAALSRFSCEAEIVSSIWIYNDAWGGRRGGVITVSILPQIFDQQLDMNPLSPSLVTYQFARFFFLDPNATKEFRLRVNRNDHFYEVLQYLRVHSGASYVQNTCKEYSREGEIMVETNYNPLELMKNLRKYYEAEIINSHIEIYYKKKGNIIRQKSTTHAIKCIIENRKKESYGDYLK